MRQGRLAVGLGRGRAGQRGATLVEAAIVFPLLLLLTFGIWTTARAWNVHNTMNHAVREAARIGATTGDENQMSLVAQSEIEASSILWSDIDVKCFAVIEAGSGDPTCFTDSATDDRVRAQLVWNSYELGFLFFDITIDLRAQAVGRLEPGAG